MVQGRIQRARIGQVVHLLVVGSGKDGVEKSTVSVNLAIAMAKQGDLSKDERED
ncbi:MAG TPA: P-loop NTPase [Ktedonobacteraceae bacterium]|jgi:Mrp family chromosome partitioning ATPase